MSSRRSKLLTGLAMVHWSLAAVFLYSLIMGLVRTLGAKAQVPAAISIGPVSSSIFLLIFTLIARGMWQAKMWGQWLAIVIVGLCVASLGFAWYDDGDYDPDLLPVLLPFAALLTLHLLPWTWRGLRRAKLETVPPSS